jgi:hypothetical protein
MRTRTQCVTLRRYTIPPLCISTFQQLEPFNQVETRREAEGPDVGVADGPLSSFQVDAKHHTPHSPTIRRAKVGWVQALRQLLSRECRESARLHETRPRCTPIQHRQIQQHERVFLVRFQCGERPHIPNMSPSAEACKSSRGIRSEQCPAAIH